LHHDCQPVILHRREWRVWLNPEIDDAAALQAMIRPWDRDLVFDSIDPAVNNSRNEGAEFFKPGTETL
jgi:putative SOS response-associated peptidase YedK